MKRQKGGLVFPRAGAGAPAPFASRCVGQWVYRKGPGGQMMDYAQHNAIANSIEGVAAGVHWSLYVRAMCCVVNSTTSIVCWVAALIEATRAALLDIRKGCIWHMIRVRILLSLANSSIPRATGSR